MPSGLFQDIKYGLRIMAKNPWFTLVVVLTLALGIGVNSAGFSIANGFWWKKLPFQNPKEVVALGMSNSSIGTSKQGMSYPDFADIRSRAQSFKAIAALWQENIVLSTDGSPGQRYDGTYITPNLFSLVGVKPIRGRDFTVADEKWGTSAPVLISHELWQSRYGGREDVIGQVLRLNARPAIVVGVMPPGFKFPFTEQVWTPIRPWGGETRDFRNLSVFARLADGISIQQAQSEVSGIAQTIAHDHPDTNKGYDAVVLTFLDWLSEPTDNIEMSIFLGGFAFVLLIACANAANLLLSRAVQRARDVSIRTALGASRWRIARQVLVESVMLSLLGGAVGFFLAQGGVRWFTYAVASLDAPLPFWINFEMDYRAFAYFLVICAGTGIVFGSVPAFQISRTNVNDNLKEGSRQTTGGSRARRMAAALLVAEIAMTVMLVAQSGLLLRGFLKMTHIDVGVDSKNLIIARVDIPYATYLKEPERAALLENFVERFQRPDRLTTFAWAVPMEGTWNKPLQLQDRNIADTTGKPPQVGTLPVGKDYFTTLTVKLVRGRNFDARDGHPGTEAVIVNQRFAETYWPAANPLGKRLRLGDDKTPWLTVVGVSPDLFQAGNFRSGEIRPTVYVPYRLSASGQPVILIRSAQTEAAVRDLRAELTKIDPDLAPYLVMTFDELRRFAFRGDRFFGTLMAMLSVMALVMASIGLYGVTAHGVNQRTREIGIRSALGASRLRVIWMVVRQSLPRIVTGLAIGLVAAALLSQLTTSIVIGVVDPQDPLIFLSTFLILALVTIIAVLIPAWRASKLNPCVALRSE